MIKHFTLAVIVPVYNTREYIDEFLTSVLNQTYKDYKLYLVNDGSTDDSLYIIKKYEKIDSRIRVIDKSNNGASSARNAGLEAVEGSLETYDYIYFVDSDDRLDINVFEKCIDALNASKADCCFFNVRKFSKNTVCNESSSSCSNNRVLNHDEIVQHYFKINRKSREDCTSQRFLNNKIFRYCLVKNLRFDQRLVRSNDFDFFVRLLPYLNRAIIVPDVFFHYRLRKSSLSNSIMQSGNLLLALKAWETVNVKSEIEKKAIQRVLLEAYYEAICISLYTEDWLTYDHLNNKLRGQKFFFNFDLKTIKLLFRLTLPFCLQKRVLLGKMEKVQRKKKQSQLDYFD